MAVSEESRHHLYQRLEQVLGPAEATVLMEHLPPVGWADVATKRDIDALETRVNMRFDRVDDRLTCIDQRFDEVDRRFERMDRRFDQFERGLHDLPREFRSLLISVMTVMAVLFATMMGAVVAAVKI